MYSYKKGVYFSEHQFYYIFDALVKNDPSNSYFSSSNINANDT